MLIHPLTDSLDAYQISLFLVKAPGLTRGSQIVTQLQGKSLPGLDTRKVHQKLHSNLPNQSRKETRCGAAK